MLLVVSLGLSVLHIERSESWSISFRSITHIFLGVYCLMIKKRESFEKQWMYS